MFYILYERNTNILLLLRFFIYIYIFIFVPPLHICYKTPVKTIIYFFNVKHILYINDKHFWNISVTLSLLKSFFLKSSGLNSAGKTDKNYVIMPYNSMYLIFGS